MQHLLETTQWCSEGAADIAKRAVLKRLADADPRLWLQGDLLSATDTFPATATRLINAGVDKELLLLAAADKEHAAAGRWLVEEHGATGIKAMASGDGSKRSVCDVGKVSSDTDVRDFFNSLGSYLGRYILSEAQYRSPSCEVFFGTDFKDNDRRVAVKKLTYKQAQQHFERELKAREHVKDLDCVVQAVAAHVPDGLDVSGLGDLTRGEPTAAGEFCIVMDLAGANLKNTIDNNQLLAGNNEMWVQMTLKDIASGLEQIHAAGLVHCDSKLRNWIRITAGGREVFKAIDFDAAVQQGEVIGDKLFTGFCPPEVACALLEPGSPIAADTSFDAWSFGVIAFRRMTNSDLQVIATMDGDDNLEDAALRRLCDWNMLPKREQVRVLATAPPLQRRKAQDLLQRCLQRDPSQRLTAQ